VVTGLEEVCVSVE
jgi:hypothetical protein